MNTGPGRTDNDLGIFEDLDESSGRFLSFFTVTGIEGRLSAACLVGRAVKGKVQFAKNFYHGLADFGGETVDQALNEKGHFFECHLHLLAEES